MAVLIEHALGVTQPGAGTADVERERASRLARLAAASVVDVAARSRVEPKRYLTALRTQAHAQAGEEHATAIALLTAALDGDSWLLGFALDGLDGFDPATLAALATITAGNVLALEVRDGEDGDERIERLAGLL